MKTKLLYLLLLFPSYKLVAQCDVQSSITLSISDTSIPDCWVLLDSGSNSVNFNGFYDGFGAGMNNLFTLISPELEPGNYSVSLAGWSQPGTYIILDAVANQSQNTSGDYSYSDYSNYVLANGGVFGTSDLPNPISINITNNNKHLMLSFVGPLPTSAYLSELIATSESLGVMEFDAEDTFRIYPNPTNGIVNIDLSGGQDILDVQLFNVLGKKVFQEKKSGQLNLNSLKSGVYFARIQTKNRTVLRRIVKN
ncbi:T9SS type A sorting domain-containing protein [Mangrovimonas sp. CR14]|uniref:T9SS type A sorting domain-containing protein n=1 Tax=Mangrovimonas sp. CR14 TaxID=2706120 RepID=UPI0014227DCB|nr:T9SS type A sorting domain-containing protein [Mangrovimonas sp. CR14]NIK92339.1 T9SS type A sorting domain-containing protein [Mangrovimonas sp. CR14]